MEQRASSTEKTRRARSSVTLLHVHLVFVVKYRRRVLSARALNLAASAAYATCAENGWMLEEINGESDHLHLMVAYGPATSISDLVRTLKTATSRAIRKAAFPEVLRRLRGTCFWSPSYFASSCGGAPLEVIKRYIEGQGSENEKKQNRRAGSTQSRPEMGNCAVSRGSAKNSTPGFGAQISR